MKAAYRISRMLKRLTGAGRLIRLVCVTRFASCERYQKPLFVIENGFGAYDKVEDDGSIK